MSSELRVSSAEWREGRRLLVLGILAAGFITGCSSDEGPTTPAQVPTSLQMYLSGLPVSRSAFAGMQQTTTLTFSAQVKDAQGRVIASAKPTLVSRNPAAISLDADGTMHVVGRGSAWLVAGYIDKGRLMSDSMSAGLVCTTIAIAGLNVTVTDSATNAPVFANSLSISARSGAFRDSVFYATQTLPLSLGLAYERPGTWEVRITAAGYQPWAATGIVIGTDLCHVIPVSLSAKLQRQ
jgi:hypothetical protein